MSTQRRNQMNNTPVGTKVLAVRDGDEKTINYYGVGTYVGNEFPPMMGNPEPNEEEKADIIKAITEYDQGQGEQMLTELLAAGLAQGTITQEQHDADLEKALARMKEDQARPMDDRVSEYWHSMKDNPKIVLDDDKGTVWGFMCWWGPEEQFRQKYPDHEFVEVPLPDELVSA